MFYQLKPTFEAVQEKPAEGVPWVEVITQQEMDSQVTQHPYWPAACAMATAARQSCSTTVPPAPC